METTTPTLAEKWLAEGEATAISKAYNVVAARATHLIGKDTPEMQEAYRLVLIDLYDWLGEAKDKAAQ